MNFKKCLSETQESEEKTEKLKTENKQEKYGRLKSQHINNNFNLNGLNVPIQRLEECIKKKYGPSMCCL